MTSEQSLNEMELQQVIFDTRQAIERGHEFLAAAGRGGSAALIAVAETTPALIERLEADVIEQQRELAKLIEDLG